MYNMLLICEPLWLQLSLVLLSCLVNIITAVFFLQLTSLRIYRSPCNSCLLTPVLVALVMSDPAVEEAVESGENEFSTDSDHCSSNVVRLRLTDSDYSSGNVVRLRLAQNCVQLCDGCH